MTRLGMAAALVVVGSMVLTVGAQSEDVGERRPAQPQRDAERLERDVFSFLERHLPHRVEGLREVREEEPDDYRRELNEIADQMREFEEMRKVAPAVAEALMRAECVDHACEVLAEQIMASDDVAVRDGLKQELRKKLGVVFELRMSEPQMELRMLEREMEEIRSRLERRREHREMIVEKRFEAMLQEGDDALGWW